MPPRYCFDTSGFSNPRETQPEDIYESLWDFVRAMIESGAVAVTKEIHDEMCHINDGLGKFIAEREDLMVFEVAKGDWDWERYIDEANSLVDRYRPYISEYSGGSPKTICLKDMSIIALAKTLDLPVVSMETRILDLSSSNKRRIPNICDAEGVIHLTFNEFLRKEQFKAKR